MVKKQIEDNKWEQTYWRWLVAFIFVCIVAGIIIFLIFRSLPAKPAADFKPSDNAHQEEENNENQENILATSTRLYLEKGKSYTAVIIDNHFDIWEDQFGLSFAPIVYNVPVEGGATRLMAIFDLASDLNLIGPVRSARPYYLDLFREYTSIIVHVGGSPEALGRIADLNLQNLNEMSAAGHFFTRSGKLSMPHNTFISIEDIKQGIEMYNYETDIYFPGIKYQINLPVSQLGQSINIDYSARATYDIDYKYNVDWQAYERFRAGEQQFDALTQENILVDNIVIQKVPAEVILDDKLRIALDVLGKGEALFFINGHKIEGSWEKLKPTEQTKYYNQQGEEMIFKQGNIWIEVVPEGHAVTIN